MEPLQATPCAIVTNNVYHPNCTIIGFAEVTSEEGAMGWTYTVRGEGAHPFFHQRFFLVNTEGIEIEFQRRREGWEILYKHGSRIVKFGAYRKDAFDSGDALMANEASNQRINLLRELGPSCILSLHGLREERQVDSEEAIVIGRNIIDALKQRYDESAYVISEDVRRRYAGTNYKFHLEALAVPIESIEFYDSGHPTSNFGSDN